MPVKQELDGQCLRYAKIFDESGNEEIQMGAEGTRKHNYRHEAKLNSKISIYTDLVHQSPPLLLQIFNSAISV